MSFTFEIKPSIQKKNTPKGLTWSHDDPREHISKRGTIVILRPGLKGFGHQEAGSGQVDTKEGWSITTSFDNHRCVAEQESWDSSWVWISAP